jgi:2',3'-cyclic-nucleotide 2'-phosphodiesterase (5'-nucleotidase family)
MSRLPVRLAPALLGATVAAITLIAAPAVRAAEQTITFLMVNDIDTIDKEKVRGGFARLAAVARAEKARDPETIYVHAGDMISPSLMSAFDKGANTVDVLNLMPPDVFVPGNHEYDFGPDVFRQRMGELKVGARLAANLREADGAKVAGFDDWKLVEVKGVKIGIFGMTASDAYEKSSPGTLKITDTVKASFEAARELRGQGADLIVGVVHAARHIDNTLYNSGVFDLILTGDDHDLMVQYNGKTAIVESSENARFVTAVDLAVDVQTRDGKRVANWSPNFRIIDTATVTPDPVTEVKAEEYRKQLSRELDVEIGKIEIADLDSRRATVRAREAAIGNLVADAARWATKADVAIINGGGIRANKLYTKGAPITRRDVLSELPFGNRDVLIEVTGERIVQALENGVSMVETEQGRFPQVSGLSFEYEPAKPAGSRIAWVKVGGQPIDPKKIYRLATNDFMASGGDGYRMLRNAKQLLNERDAKLNANNVMAYIVETGKVTTGVEGRIIAK